MVRVAGLDRPGGGRSRRRSPDGRTPQQTLAEARERVLELYGEQSRSSGRRSSARARRGRDRRLERRELDAGGARRARRALRARDLPGADAARGRARPAVPVHLAALDQPRPLRRATPTRGEERFARVKVPEGLPRFFPVGRRGALRAARAASLAHYLPELFPGMEILERSLFRVTRDARPRGVGRGRRPARGGRARAAPRALRRGDAARGVRVDVARRCASGCSRGCASPTSSSIRSTGCSTSPISASCRSSTGPT